jgi:SAM-dependent methyltransferase
VGFDAGWLAARRRYDETALYQPAVAAIRAWAAAQPPDRTLIMVDLGSGTGAALERARAWLAPHPLLAYAVDRDAELLSQTAADSPLQAASASRPSSPPPVRLLGDILQPLTPLGGPADGTVDLVVGHALADLLPLNRLATRVAALLRPGGLAHLALAYDGETAFAPPLPPDLASLELRVLKQFHAHMDRPRATCLEHGGSTSGRRLVPTLTDAGLEVVADGPSVWHVAASDGPDGQRVLDWLLRFVADAATDLRQIAAPDLDRWLQARQAGLAAGTLAARVTHRDALVRRPSPARRTRGGHGADRHTTEYN